MPTHRHGRWLLIGGLGLVIALAEPARAAAPTDQLKQHVDRVIKTLDDPALKGEQKTRERRQAIRKIADEIFDLEETSKRALGPHWHTRTPAERQEFVQLFGDLLEHAYISRIDQYDNQKVRYLGDSIDGGQAVVRTRIITRQGTEVPVDYRMHQRDGRWLVYDVVIEGVSLVANYRTQFNRIIQTGSYDELVQKLRGKAFAVPEGKGRT